MTAPAARSQGRPVPVDPASERGQQLTRALAENHAAVRARLAREAAAAQQRASTA